MRSRALLFTGGVAAGALTGWMLAQRRFSTHQRDLFSPRPLRRLGALGYLAGQTGVDTIRLLRDYLAQLGQTSGGAVMSEALVQCVACCVDDVGRRIEIGFSNLEMDNVAPLGLQRSRFD